MERHFVGVDVGSASVRAGVFSATGLLRGSGRAPIEIWRDGGRHGIDLAEQSSDDIWASVGRSVRTAIAEARIGADDVGGIGFTATCSLVALDRDGQPTTVSPSGEARRNVVMWMDHRAVAEADAINAGEHAVLGFLGGAISPEMQTPKLAWLKRRLPEAYDNAGHWFDLGDFLTWRATGALERSLCTTVCKWTYLAGEGRWDGDYFRAIGLDDMVEDRFARIGNRIVPPGSRLARGLVARAAADLGLRAGTPVGACLIDAHAGALATLGGLGADGQAIDPCARVAAIMGTSNCLMALSAIPRQVPGLWGPYLSAVVPDLFLTEGGQTAAGAAIDHLVESHPAHAEAVALARAAGKPLLTYLERRAIETVRQMDLPSVAHLAAGLHVLPDFLGNRSPDADPHARGAIVGLGLERDVDSLVRLCLAGLIGLAHESGRILDALAAAGHAVEALVVSGGLSASPLVRQILADATGRPVVLPETAEPVLLGAAMLGALACGHVPDAPAAMHAMTRSRAATAPVGGSVAVFHDARRVVHMRLRDVERAARTTMAGVPARGDTPSANPGPASDPDADAVFGLDA